MNSVISVENLGKKYLLSHKGRESYAALRDVIANRIRTIGARLFTPGSLPESSLQEEFWALRDVSFEVKQGERLGIIGRNGAGKSTLLKILSRITEPTEGRVRIRGRVASLLEVGTGFHPELTGRENIFLNGAILGMGRAEIAGKFDEIVAFAEVEKFLDTPVKRYSSGMYVRLAFAVAAHLEPEILIVDEVLAVGDAQFQKKCMGKMEEVGREGRTVLFVSHNTVAIEALCTTGIILNQGNILFYGDARVAVRKYEDSIKITSVINISDRVDRQGSQAIKCVNIKLFNQSGEPSNVIDMGSSFSVEIIIEGFYANTIVGILIGNGIRAQMIRGYTYESFSGDIDINGTKIVKCHFYDFPMIHGTYNIHIWLGRPDNVADYIENAAELIIAPKDIYGTGKLLDPLGGVAFCKTSWEFN
jgi:lipopolysaccharide transport system ATP-binding protein